MASVKLKQGNLFDEPSDLVVLPCSTRGTVTDFVANHLREYDIPRPSQMRLGGVDIQPLAGAETVAQFVAFAASVGTQTSNRTIAKIGASLGKATREYEAVRRVSAPLLGTGNAGIPSEDSVDSLSTGFKKEAAEDAVLTIFVLRGDVGDVVDRLRRRHSETPKVQKQKPKPQSKQKGIGNAAASPLRVFVSYSGTSDCHRDWVAELATYLRSNGLDARLDQWHLRGGMDLPQWMANELQMADRVVVISDSRYTERADGRVGGVGWETMLIQGDMVDRPPIDNRYLLLVREDDLSSGVPRFLKTKYCIQWSSDADESQLRRKLLEELYNVDTAPPIGKPPVWV